MVYMCLAGGYFSKRLTGKPVSAQQQKRYGTKSNDLITEKLTEFEKLGFPATAFLL